MEQINLEVEAPKKTQKKKGLLIGIVVTVSVALFVGVILLCALTSTGGTSSYLTYENYLKICNGMTYTEVVNILGGQKGELDSSAGNGEYRLEYYSWTSSVNYDSIVVCFENGKVSAKSQFGLN